MARHAVVDLTLVFISGPVVLYPDRLPPEKLVELRRLLSSKGRKLHEGDAVDRKLQELRLLYEPYINSLATHFQVSLPPWIADESWVDNWQGSFWDRHGRDVNSMEKRNAEHF
jgi:hypothetical protein